IVARLEREDRRVDLACALRGPRVPVSSLTGPPVEPDRTGKAVAARGRQPRVAAAEAEADREDRAAALRAEMVDRSADIGLDPLRCGLLDVGHVLEVLAALGRAGSAAEVVERDGRDPALGEPQSELLVEAVEAADVGEDDDADLRRLVRRRVEGGEAVAVGGFEDEVLVGDGSSADD